MCLFLYKQMTGVCKHIQFLDRLHITMRNLMFVSNADKRFLCNGDVYEYIWSYTS